MGVTIAEGLLGCFHQTMQVIEIIHLPARSRSNRARISSEATPCVGGAML